MKEIIRKIYKKSKYSYAISIPKELIKEFKWKEKQKLTLIPHPRKKSIEIKDWKKYAN